MAHSQTVTVSGQGRIVLPAPIRHALGFEPGVELLARVEGDHLVLERREAAVARLRARFANVRTDPSVVDELVAERREEARREASG
ncbi:MAG: AbrB/MazE/SpoVT family DNA-binding domain-containing protein [Acidimicrobiales bacterium]